MSGDASARGFRRALVATLVLLAVLVAVFAALGISQGPKLSNAQVDVDGVVRQSGQQLRLFANQAVSRVSDDQVTVTPAALTSVTTSGDVIAVQFDGALRYDTDYTVRVEGVTSIYLDQPSTISYTFRSGSSALYYLDRASPDADGTADGSAEDAIVRTGIRSTERDVVFSAPHIQDFVVVDKVIAVVTEDDAGTSALSIVSSSGGSAGGGVESVPLPDDGTIEDLHANAATGYVGFAFTSAGDTPADPAATEYNNTLLAVNLINGRELQPVLGIDGAPIEVLDWEFVPGSTRMVAQNTDQSVALIDLADAAAITPLGQFTQFGQLSTDGSTLVVGDASGLLALSLSDGSTTRLTPSPLDDTADAQGVVPSGGAAQVLAGTDGQMLQQVAVFDESSGRFSSYLVVDNGASSRIVFQTVKNQGSIERFTVSPNGQYVAVETVPNVANSVSDGYSIDARSTTISTVFIDISSGAVVKSVEGFAPSW